MIINKMHGTMWKLFITTLQSTVTKNFPLLQILQKKTPHFRNIFRWNRQPEEGVNGKHFCNLHELVIQSSSVSTHLFRLAQGPNEIIYKFHPFVQKIYTTLNISPKHYEVIYVPKLFPCNCQRHNTTIFNLKVLGLSAHGFFIISIFISWFAFIFLFVDVTG